MSWTRAGVLACVVLAGCGGARGGGARTPGGGGGLQAEQSFPTRASIAALPPPGPVHVDSGMSVGHWEIEPASLAPGPAALDPLYARLAVDRASAQRALGLECVAREIARFASEHQALPADAVRRFLAARCGAVANGVATAVLSVQARSGGSDADAVAHLVETRTTDIVESIDPVADRIGLGLFRQGDAIYVAIASALSQVVMEPALPIAADGHLRFHLRIARSPDRLLVMATAGERGVAACAVTGASPELDVDCPWAEGDQREYVEIAARDGDAVFCTPLALVAGIAADGAGLAYDLRVPTTQVAIEGGDLGEAVLPLLNGERAQSGAPALALSAAQSAADAEVAPYVFGGDIAGREQAMLYAMAGWDLGDGPMVREGRVIQVDTGAATDAGEWLYRALETPLERWVLMDPEARVVAVGTTRSDGHTFGLASTYRFFDGDPERDRAAAEAALLEARRVAGRPAPQLVHDPALDAAAVDIAERGEDPSVAIDRALSQLVQTYASARGGAYVASVLENVPWSEPVMAAPRVGIAVRHAQPEGAAWGVYVVVVVALP